MTSCEHFELLISQYLDDELSTEELESLNAHIQACADCKELYDDLSTLKNDFSASLLTPPTHMHDTIMKSIQNESFATEQTPHQINSKKIHRTWISFAAMFAVIISSILVLYPNLNKPSTMLVQESIYSTTDSSPNFGGANEETEIDNALPYSKNDSANEEMESAEIQMERDYTPELSGSSTNMQEENEDIMFYAESSPQSSEMFDSEIFIAENAPTAITEDEATTILLEYLSEEGTLTFTGLTNDKLFYLFSFTHANETVTEFKIAIYTGEVEQLATNQP